MYQMPRNEKSTCYKNAQKEYNQARRDERAKGDELSKESGQKRKTITGMPVSSMHYIRTRN